MVVMTTADGQNPSTYHHTLPPQARSKAAASETSARAKDAEVTRLSKLLEATKVRACSNNAWRPRMVIHAPGHLPMLLSSAHNCLRTVVFAAHITTSIVISGVKIGLCWALMFIQASEVEFAGRAAEAGEAQRRAETETAAAKQRCIQVRSWAPLNTLPVLVTIRIFVLHCKA
jgi:hypothetical protein